VASYTLRVRPAPDLHVEWVEGEAVVLDTATGHLHYLNASAALGFALILERGIEGAAAELRSNHGPDPQQVDQEFSKLVADLSEKGLLVE
jgi:hypothetical protein